MINNYTQPLDDDRPHNVKIFEDNYIKTLIKLFHSSAGVSCKRKNVLYLTYILIKHSRKLLRIHTSMVSTCHRQGNIKYIPWALYFKYQKS